MKKITFKEDTHQYFVDGIEYVSTSEVLKVAGISNYSGVPEHILNHARDRGDAAHYATRLDDMGILDESTVHPEVMPYLEAWRAFRLKNDTEWVAIEGPLFSDKYGFCTTPDRIGFVGSMLTDLEIKCIVKPMPSFGIQTASHLIAWDENNKKQKIKKRIVVMLMKSGGFHVRYCDEKSDKTIFLNALNLYQWKKKHNLIRKET